MNNDIKINGQWAGLPNVMKKLNFVEDVGFFTRKFVRVYVEDNKLYIGHCFESFSKNKKKEIEFDDLKMWIDYFDRI